MLARGLTLGRPQAAARLGGRRLTAAAAAAAPPPPPPPPDSGGVGPINKEVVATRMDARLYEYLLRHTPEPPPLRRLREATAARFPGGARMQVSPEQGAFLAWLVEALGVRSAIEVGVFTGYSSTAMALALPRPGGRLLALDRDGAALAAARGAWADAGVADLVEPRLGPAADSLAELLARPGAEGSFDLAFIDADKRGYRGYYEACLRLVRPGGVVLLDNVLWYGKVADPAVTDAATAALRELNAFVAADARVRACVVPVGDGMALCRKK